MSMVRHDLAAHWKAGILITLVILFGSWLRLSGLGAAPLSEEELQFHYAANALSEGKGTLLPSGASFQRALPITFAISASRRFLGSETLTARLPGALAGIASLVLMAIAGWLIAGPWAAVWGTALLAIYPEAVEQSRTARFLSLQLCLAVLAFAAGWWATLHTSRKESPGGRERLRSWLWSAIAGCALLAAFALQSTVLAIGVALTAWFVSVAAAAVIVRGRQSLRDSVPLQLVMLGTIAAAAALVLVPQLFSLLWNNARFVPLRAGGEPQSSLLYATALLRSLPWILALLPLYLIVAAKEKPAATLYCLFWFGVSFIVYSWILLWRDERLILPALPPLFLLAGIALSRIAKLFHEVVLQRLDSTGARGAASFVASGVTALAVLWLLATSPAFSMSLGHALAHDSSRAANWAAAHRAVRQTIDPDAIALGSSDPLSMLHSWKRVDFGVARGLRDHALTGPASSSGERFPAATSLPRDYFAGAPIADDVTGIRNNYSMYDSVLIVVDNAAILSGSMSRDLVDTLRAGARELCREQCGTLRVFLWTLRPTVSDSMTMADTSATIAHPRPVARPER